MEPDVVAIAHDPWEIELTAEDMTVETLDTSALLGTVGSFATGACASCPVGCASSAGTFSSAG